MKLAKYARVTLPERIYLGGETITPGDASAQATLPSTAKIIEIAAETQACYYAINHAAAGTGSPGYIATGHRTVIGPLGNLTGLSVFSVAGGIVHIQYFREG